MNKKQNKIKLMMVLFLSIYSAFFFTNILLPRVQLFIENKTNTSSDLHVFLFDDDEYLSSLNEKDYIGNLNINNKTHDIHVVVNNNNYIEKCYIDGKEKQIVDINRYTKRETYNNFVCIKSDLLNNKFYLIFIILIIIFFIIIHGISNEIFINGKYNGKLTYSNSGIKVIGKKPIYVSFLITIISLIFYYGCDIEGLSEFILLHQSGIDTYQMFAAINKYKNAQLLMWQYDGAMLMGYNLFSYILYPFKYFFDPYKYHLIQALEYKLINITLLNLTVISIISFLLDKGLITNLKAKKIYYWSIFNPMTYYVGIIFIQFDLLPIYCVTLGILLLDDYFNNRNCIAFFIAYGVSTKMTIWMFLPSIILLLIFVLMKNGLNKKWLNIIFKIVLLLSIMVIIPRLYNTPTSKALSNLVQSERIWYTSLQYAPEVFLFLAIFGLIYIFIINALNITLQGDVNNIIISTLYSLATITLIFSCLTLSTPAFYLNTIPAFTILYAEKDDKFNRILIAFFGVLMVFSYMFAIEGDITAFLYFFNKTPIFTQIMFSIDDNMKKIKWISLLFTISSASMFSFAIVFLKKANEYIKK